MQVTELEMLEAEKYWCENCCNWDKEQVRMDGYANCKLTGTLCFAQESGKACKCFNVPAENVIVPPCKVGDVVYEIDLPEYGIIVCEVTKVLCDSREVIVNVTDGHGKGSEYYFEFDDFGKTVFLTKEEAEEALKGE